MKILIVEDNEYKLRTVQRILEKNQMNEYDVADCAVDALMKCEEYQYDLLILDLGFNWRRLERESYKIKQGLRVLKFLKGIARRKKSQMPEIIIYSETQISEGENEIPIFGKADNEIELMKILQDWIDKKDKPIKKILIVEDSLTKSKKVEDELKLLGIEHYKVVTCSAKAKEECMKNYDIDIIILDMQFPYFEGDEPKYYAGYELISDLEREYENKGKEMPKIIVFSTIEIEELWKKNNESIPEFFYGQVVFIGDLRRKMKELI